MTGCVIGRFHHLFTFPTLGAFWEAHDMQAVSQMTTFCLLWHSLPAFSDICQPAQAYDTVIATDIVIRMARWLEGNIGKCAEGERCGMGGSMGLHSLPSVKCSVGLSSTESFSVIVSQLPVWNHSYIYIYIYYHFLKLAFESVSVRDSKAFHIK
jgi:hypothetical protein